jgi:putative ABC transport system permease protein
MSVAEVGGNPRGKDIRSQMKLPFRKAVEISVKSIKIRFARSVITASGIFLGIAFFSSVRTSAMFTDIQKNIVQYKITQRQSGVVLSPADMQMISAASADPTETRNARTRLEWLSIMGLIVCTVGITNAMLMSVTERYKEIGTMKCLGALDSFVVKLFFIESCVLGFLASLLGGITGWLVISLINIFTIGLQAFNGEYGAGSLSLILVCTFLGTLLTFFATIAPAIRAAKMPPAAALRVEI